VDPERELIVHTDWSVHGIGAVLGQRDDEGQEYLCACASRSLNSHERNYPSYKGELLALTWATRMFRHHLHGTKFRLITDHQPLTWLMSSRDLNGQYARWQLLLQEYDFEVEHRAGIKHQNADVLSRFPQPSSKDKTGARLDATTSEAAITVAAVSTTNMTAHQLDMLRQYYCGNCKDGCPGSIRVNLMGRPSWRWRHDEVPGDPHDPKASFHRCRECCNDAVRSVWDDDDSDWHCAQRCAEECDLPPPSPPPWIVAALDAGGIDGYAPKFDRLLGNNGVTHVDSHYYMEAALRDPTWQQMDPDAQLQETAVAKAVVKAFRLTRPPIQAVMEQGKRSLPPTPTAKLAKAQLLDNRLLDASFFKRAREGLSLLELCAGISSSLEALLRAGVRIKRYHYVDKDPLARKVAAFRLANLSARYPDLFPPSAWASAFELPQDVTAIQDYHLHQTLTEHQTQWMLVAGWPCQDYSAAGIGRMGQRAALLDDVTRILSWLQQHQQTFAPAYLLENVAMQHNFRHAHVRFEVFDQVVKQLGEPVTFDAAQVGSHAHRLRNYWTNMADPKRMNQLFSAIDCPHEHVLQDLLGPGRHPMPVTSQERSNSGRTYNEPGRPRVVFPTMMSFRLSRAFRKERPGSIYDSNTGLYDEPNPEERELAMGFEASSTACPEVSDLQRNSLLGQAMDVNALVSLWHAARCLAEDSAAPASKSAHMPYTPPAMVATMESMTTPGDQDDTACRHDDDSGRIQQSTDIWEDQHTMAFLRNQIAPADAKQASRVRKRAVLFRWFNNRLFKMVRCPLSETLAHRLVPPPAEREEIILSLHTNLGHVGEKRTTAALSDIYWWHGMTLDVKRVLSTCKLCHRVRAGPADVQRDMQTEPHTYGMFTRWGIDYVGELTPSARGHRHALVCIDYYSKWVEVFPVVACTMEITKQLVLTQLIARYGVPEEIVSDNGAAFGPDFKQFCTTRGINHRQITADHPQSNGLAERAVQTIKRSLKKYAAQQHGATDWDTEGLSSILLGYRVTPQAATGFSPAQIMFAQNPAVNSDAFASKVPPLTFEDIEVDAERLLARARISKQIGVQVRQNLTKAHERNAARFKAVRSGLVTLPKSHRYREGDHVFLIDQRRVLPGGALGIRVRDEILRVTDVRDSGVLELENQAGQRFTRHKEHCSPCTLTNIREGTHTGLVRPPANLKCLRCHDHRKGASMLLCDSCDAPWHTFCLPVPLAEVPDGDWLCPDCLDAGITLEQLARHKQTYIPVEPSRPALELPSPQRRATARAAAEKWHAAAIVHGRDGRERYGRVTFQGILSPKWFRVDWLDGTNSQHHAAFFKHCGVLDPAGTPPGVLPAPPPITVAFTVGPLIEEDINWSILTGYDLGGRLNQLMPGPRNRMEAHTMHRSLNRRQRALLTRQSSAAAVEMLFSIINLDTCRVILDPWADNKAVQQYFGTRRLFIANDRLGRKGADLQYEPLEPVLYTKLIGALGSIDAVVTIPPPLLLDLAVVTAVEFASTVTCFGVPVSWAEEDHVARAAYFATLVQEERLLWIRPAHPDAAFGWLCIFANATRLQARLRPIHRQAHYSPHIWVER